MNRAQASVTYARPFAALVGTPSHLALFAAYDFVVLSHNRFFATWVS